MDLIVQLMAKAGGEQMTNGQRGATSSILQLLNVNPGLECRSKANLNALNFHGK